MEQLKIINTNNKSKETVTITPVYFLHILRFYSPFGERVLINSTSCYLAYSGGTGEKHNCSVAWSQSYFPFAGHQFGTCATFPSLIITIAALALVTHSRPYSSRLMLHV